MTQTLLTLGSSRGRPIVGTYESSRARNCILLSGENMYIVEEFSQKGLKSARNTKYAHLLERRSKSGNKVLDEESI